MAFLIQEIIWFLLLTAVLWGAIGWWLRSVGQRKIVDSLVQENEHKMHSLRRARDDYRDQLEEMAAAGGALNSKQKAQVTDYVRKLEDKISTGKTQIESLTGKLDDLAKTTQQREAKLRAMQEALKQATDGATPTAELEAAAEALREHKRSIAKLNERIAALSRQKAEPMATQEHARLLDVIRAQKETIAGMVRKLESDSSDASAVREKKREDPTPQLERTIALRDKELNRAREQIAQMHERAREMEKTIIRLENTAAPSIEKEDPERATLLQAMQEQERIIVTLKEQLHERVTPPTRATNSVKNSRSGDLFSTPPTVLQSAPDGERDNLQKIHGVGPVLEAKLNELGIFHFHQVAALDDGDIGWIAGQMNAFPNRILRDRWVSQAAKLIATGAPD